MADLHVEVEMRTWPLRIQFWVLMHIAWFLGRFLAIRRRTFFCLRPVSIRLRSRRRWQLRFMTFLVPARRSHPDAIRF